MSCGKCFESIACVAAKPTAENHVTSSTENADLVYDLLTYSSNIDSEAMLRYNVAH